ncbi:MAG: hypothetical protein ACXAC8_06015 [Candidatus Hodarchaeales archaeon]|jgi:hypothetical protein
MKTLQLSEEIFDWTGTEDILTTPYYKIVINEPTKLIEVTTDSSVKGVIILGKIKVVVDTLIYNTSHGALGNTTTFSGTNLVVLGLPLSQVEEFLVKSALTDEEIQNWNAQAETMISKLRSRVEDPTMKMDLSIDHDDKDCEYIIFGRRNFLLIGSEKKFVLIHKEQISVREGERKLVQISSQDGIVVAEKNKVLNIGGSSKANIGSLLGELGVNIASTVLDQVLWG